MSIKRISFIGILILLAGVVSACGSLEIGVEFPGETPGVEEGTRDLVVEGTQKETDPLITTNDTTSEPSATTRYTFEGLGISLEVPNDLYVIKDPLVNYDDQSRLDSYLFYIQNYGYPGGPSSGSFQMYGHLQYSLPSISWEEFSSGQISSPMNAYADYIEVGGLRGYDTQVAGERNRYVYHFYLDGAVLSIAVADPTPENKALSDEIIASLVFTPGGFSSASHVRLVSEPSGLYQMLLPDDWSYAFEETIGLQVSSLSASSPDSEVVIDSEVEGPHDNIYYNAGISLHVQVIEDETPSQSPGWPNQQEYTVYFNGVPGTAYIYVEPSTVEGELRSVHVYYEGRSYVLRFGYAQDADISTIDRIIANFKITPDDFYPTQ